jgi:hypothetical protein
MFFSNINYVVIIIATFLGMAVGFIWYAPWAFGKLWMKSKGLTTESMTESTKSKPMWPMYLATTIGTFATAFVLSVLFNSLVVIGFWGIVSVGFLLWLGFIAPAKLNDHLYGGESITYVLITAGHLLVATVVMAFVIGIFG